MYLLILYNNSQDADKTMNKNKTFQLLLSILPDALYKKYDTLLNFEDTYAICVYICTTYVLHGTRLSIYTPKNLTVSFLTIKWLFINNNKYLYSAFL